jgi:hypothetical protein
MNATKETRKRAMEQVEVWRALGVPFFITAYEAHNLTSGAVGDPIGANHSYRALHIAEVAVKFAKVAKS